jgi:hypothetical protein
MRQKNSKDIKINGLEEKKARREHKERIIKGFPETKFKDVVVPGDPFHTKFIVPVETDSQEVINRYLKSREYK